MGRIHDMVDDFKQEAELAMIEGADPVDAVRFAYRYWVFGRRGHHRSKIEIPKFVDVSKVQLSTPSIEADFADREFLNKLWNTSSVKARAAIKAAILGKRHVWRTEVKKELLEKLLAA